MDWRIWKAELMEPTAEGDVSRLLDRWGEGIFVVSYQVSDVDHALAELKGSLSQAW